jgi:alpha-tubulin suppressor-like RCC1 family protein
VNTISEISKIAAGNNFSIALKKDGTVWTWGSNSDGQLGTGDNTAANKPGMVNNLSGITKITGGWYHVLALKNDGKLWVWGDNGAGQLGIGNSTDAKTPVQPQGLCVVSSVNENIIEAGIKIYPNPSNGMVTIEKGYSNESNSSYSILNSSGQQVISGQLNGTKHTIDIRHLSPGLYLIQIGDHERQTFKLMLK